MMFMERIAQQGGTSNELLDYSPVGHRGSGGKIFLMNSGRIRFGSENSESKPENSAHIKSAQRNEYAWTTLIVKRVECGQSRQALKMYEEMRRAGIEPSSHTFVALLKACSGLQNLKSAKQIHAEVVRSGYESDLFMSTMLLQVYVKCKSIVDARHTFEKMPHRDVVSWTTMITGYVQMGMGEEALKLYTCMQQEGVAPDGRTYVSALKACNAMAELRERNEGDSIALKARCLETVKAIHAAIMQGKFKLDVFVGNMLIHAYAKCGSLENARQVFEKMPRRDLVSWNAIISGYSRMGKGEEALQLYTRMHQEGVVRNGRTYVSALKAYSTQVETGNRNAGDVVFKRQRCLEAVKTIHTDILKGNFETDAFVGTMLVDAYAKCGSLEDARLVFEKIHGRSVVSWNAMIFGYAQMDKGEEALQLYKQMQKEGVVPNDRTYVGTLKACSTIADSGRTLGDGRRGWCLDAITAIHADLLKQNFESNVFVGNMLVDAYAKCGSLVDSRRVFEKMPRRDVVSWNAMISGYAQMKKAEEAMQLYTRMQQEGVIPSDRTYVSVLKACSVMVGSGEENQGGGKALKERILETVRAIHADILKRKFESDAFVGNMLVDAYAKCGSLEDAREVFEKMCRHNVVSWNAIILGYAEMGSGQEALQLYSRMQMEGVVPDGWTYVSALKACSSLAEQEGMNEGDVKERRLLTTVSSIHRDIVRARFESDSFVGSMLVDVYVKCQCLEDARRVFEKMHHHDVVSWTALILGYTQMCKGEEALQLYSQMQQKGVVPDKRTFVAALNACGSVVGLEKGKEIHTEILTAGPKAMDLFVTASLINMYAKCGSMVDARQVFDGMLSREVVAWNALMAGYAHQGDSEAVFDLFHSMKQQSLEPDGISFLTVLTVCSHVGLVERGYEYFRTMSTDYCISPTIKHFTCMVDLLGRSGQLGKAMELVKAMPFVPDSAVWQSVLGACRKWGHVELGRHAFECAVMLNQDDAAAYIIMSSIYSAAHMPEEANAMEAGRVKSGVLKKPGWSRWADVSGNAPVFVMGDRGFEDIVKLHDMQDKLGDILVKMKK